MIGACIAAGNPSLLAIAHGLIAAAQIGMKEHDRLVLARTLMERKLSGSRMSSKLPELVELAMSKPLEMTPQAARRIVLELGLRERRGRGGFGRGECCERYT